MDIVIDGQIDSYSDEDEELEYEYESTIVTFDLEGIDPTLIPNTSSFGVMGLGTPEPLLQLPSVTLQGVHQSLIGTEIIFQDGKDPKDRARRFVIPIGSTSTRLAFRQVEISGSDCPQGVQSPNTSSDDVHQPVLFAGRKKGGPSKQKSKEIYNTEVNDVLAQQQGAAKLPPKARTQKSPKENEILSLNLPATSALQHIDEIRVGKGKMNEAE